jgi:hypothetical protein
MTEERNSFPVGGGLVVAEYRELLEDLLGSAGVTNHLIDCHEIKPAVYRLKCGSDGRVTSFVAKRLKPDAASRNQLAAMRWLPSVDLAQSGPPLLGVTSDRKGEYIWHLYQDLGNCSLDESKPEIDQVEAVLRVVAEVHTRFADHPLLAECRFSGSDFGMHFFSSNVRDAIRCLEALSLHPGEFPSERRRCWRD